MKEYRSSLRSGTANFERRRGVRSPFQIRNRRRSLPHRMITMLWCVCKFLPHLGSSLLDASVVTCRVNLDLRSVCEQGSLDASNSAIMGFHVVASWKLLVIFFFYYPLRDLVLKGDLGIPSSTSSNYWNSRKAPGGNSRRVQWATWRWGYIQSTK